jgi:cysteine desulfurase
VFGQGAAIGRLRTAGLMELGVGDQSGSYEQGAGVIRHVRVSQGVAGQDGRFAAIMSFDSGSCQIGPVRIYLDHNATTPLAEPVRAAMSAALAVWGNPSSVHQEGRAARELVERARAQVAGLLAASAADIVFTSGGTEADAIGLVGLARLGRARTGAEVVLVPAIEHPAVHGAAAALVREGFRVVSIAADARGVIDATEVAAGCAAGAAALAVALVNHELGTVQDLAALAAIAHEHQVPVHCDAVQAAGRLPIEAGALGADTLAISAHKLYGPKGAGALWVRPGLDLEPVFGGGHQERGRRPGTENVAGIVGLGAAAEQAARVGLEAAPALAEIGRLLEDGLAAIDGVRIHGAGAARVPGTVNAGFEGALGEVIVTALDLAGVAVSTGAACTSGTVQPSPVLRAIGLPVERAIEAVRFSAGRDTGPDQVRAVLELLPPIVARARRFR